MQQKCHQLHGCSVFHCSMCCTSDWLSTHCLWQTGVQTTALRVGEQQDIEHSSGTAMVELLNASQQKHNMESHHTEFGVDDEDFAEHHIKLQNITSGCRTQETWRPGVLNILRDLIWTMCISSVDCQPQACWLAAVASCPASKAALAFSPGKLKSSFEVSQHACAQVPRVQLCN